MKLKKKVKKLQLETQEVLKKIKVLEKELKERIKELQKRIAVFTISHYVYEIRSKYKDNIKILDYIDSVTDDIIENLDDFLDKKKKTHKFLCNLFHIKNSQDLINIRSM